MLFAEPQKGGILYSGKFDAAVFAWFPNADGDMSNLYGCTNRAPHGQNVLQWCNPTAEAAMVRFLQTYDAAEQKRPNDIVQRQLVVDTPTYVLNVAENIFAMNVDLTGFYPNVVSSFDDMLTVDM